MRDNKQRSYYKPLNDALKRYAEIGFFTRYYLLSTESSMPFNDAMAVAGFLKVILTILQCDMSHLEVNCLPMYDAKDDDCARSTVVIGRYTVMVCSTSGNPSF